MFAPRSSFFCARLMQLLHHLRISYIWINPVIPYTFWYYSINKTCDGPKIKKRVPKNWTICETDSFRQFHMLSESFKELVPKSQTTFTLSTRSCDFCSATESKNMTSLTHGTRQSAWYRLNFEAVDLLSGTTWYTANTIFPFWKKSLNFTVRIRTPD